MAPEDLFFGSFFYAFKNLIICSKYLGLWQYCGKSVRNT